MGLQELFNSYCAFGGNKVAEMNDTKFIKLVRDSKLLDKKLTSTDCDLIFSRVKPKGGKTINYQIFHDLAIPELAKKKGLAPEELAAQLSGPASSGTKAETVKFFDDQSQYTGVHKHGGPSTIDNNTADLSHITNREGYDVRGVNDSAQRK